ncbi:MAG TPA: RIP metalloprotease RseP [Bacteroidetes bacterium]|nr:regulator of sigma-W protease RasP [bacterium BMS3Bbin04]HDO65310.1 RIP metalloprotease RseP [Bacteroidota bacterium]HEX04435.1 RIP metalloprotease RseP [Bacteroidota bacterium]
MLLTFFAFIVVLGVVIFVHEAGHFFAARATGMRVEAFSLGFVKMFGIKRGDTEYRLGYVPLGGYVKISGMIDEFGDDDISGKPWEFQSKNAFQKAFVITAGVLMNFLLGFIIYTAIAWVEGEPIIDPSPTIGSVTQGFPAQDAGIVAGDVIIRVDDTAIDSWEDFRVIVHSKPSEEVNIAWVSGTDTLSATMTTKTQAIMDDDGARDVGMVGVGPTFTREPVGIGEGVVLGARMTGAVLGLSLKSIQMLFSGDASVKDLTGPAGIVYLSGETARAGWATFLGFIALISLSIGLLNILPFPVLDGGHLVYIIIEGITGKTISSKVKIVLQNVGMALLLGLVVVVTYHDILRFFVD